MRGDLIGNASLLHIVLLGEAKMFLGGHVTKHRRAVIRSSGRADCARDVVVTGKDVRHERAEDIERCAVAEPPLQLHVELDLVKRNVPGTFDHHLAAVAPSRLGQFA